MSPTAILAAAAAVGAALSGSATEGVPPGGAAPECVIVLHGLARSARSMADLAGALAAAGFTVDNLDYPSTREPFDALVARVAAITGRRSPSCARTHFVTHSLGGLIVRAYLEQAQPPRLGRVVMIAPPNHGSEIVDAIGGTRAFRAFFGPVGAALGTSPTSLPARLGPPRFALGVIAGTHALNPLGWWLIPGANDGTVSVRSTQLEGMQDFVVVPRNHTFIMSAPEVAAQTIRFLRSGAFHHEPDAGAAP